MSRFHPSASTNSMSLKGSATSTGESIIMPSDMRMLETTMSMTRNGMKIRKPIWNADLSSLVTNAGTMTRMGAVSAVTAGSSLASRANRAKSDWRVCLSMKPRMGASARSMACSKLMVFLVYGR